MRLIGALMDTRVLLAVGVAFVIQIVLASAWMLTAGRELERSQAELEALSPEEQLDVERWRMSRLIEEFTGQEVPDPRTELDIAYEELDPADVEGAEAQLQAQIEALQRDAMVRNAGAPRAKAVGPISVRSRREDPFLLSTGGILAVSCAVGSLILLAGGAISFALLRTSAADDAPSD